VTRWPEVTLNEVFDIARGGSPRPIDDYVTDSPEGINWVTISDASEASKYITRTKRRIRREGVSRSREVKPGDFLLTNSMSFGRPYIMRTSGCIHDGWLMLSPRRSDVDAHFFYGPSGISVGRPGRCHDRAAASRASRAARGACGAPGPRVALVA
jgi:type I restriction enzyme S subunit